jgi:N6-L-threonylcarbamoyladenine synthase
VADRVARAMEIADARRGWGSDARHLVIAGGVAANRQIHAALAAVAAARGYRLHVPPLQLCTDNGAMIAWTGAERLALGLTDGLEFEARARWPLDAEATPALGGGRQGAKA